MKWIANGLLQPEQAAESFKDIQRHSAFNAFSIPSHLGTCERRQRQQPTVSSHFEYDFNAKEWSSWTDCGTPNDQSTRGGLNFLLHLRSTFRSLAAVALGELRFTINFPEKYRTRYSQLSLCMV